LYRLLSTKDLNDSEEASAPPLLQRETLEKFIITLRKHFSLTASCESDLICPLVSENPYDFVDGRTSEELFSFFTAAKHGYTLNKENNSAYSESSLQLNEETLNLVKSVQWLGYVTGCPEITSLLQDCNSCDPNAFTCEELVQVYKC
jgi:hypothetical protein